MPPGSEEAPQGQYSSILYPTPELCKQARGATNPAPYAAKAVPHNQSGGYHHLFPKPGPPTRAHLMEAVRGRCSRESITQPTWLSRGGLELCRVFRFRGICKGEWGRLSLKGPDLRNQPRPLSHTAPPARGLQSRAP